MKLYTHHTPFIVRKLFPQLLWQMEDRSDNPSIYLTFDDGPEPGLTDYVLENLNRFNARATFFVIGNKVRRHNEILKRVVEEHHAIGNHTFSHLDGWRASKKDYASNIEKCSQVLKENGIATTLFRPPYGRITWSQANQSTHRIIMWNYLSGDFDLKLNCETAKKKLKPAGNGSIVVFHDNIRFESNLKKLLPWFLEEFANRGYNFKSIPQDH